MGELFRGIKSGLNLYKFRYFLYLLQSFWGKNTKKLLIGQNKFYDLIIKNKVLNHFRGVLTCRNTQRCLLPLFLYSFPTMYSKLCRIHLPYKLLRVYNNLVIWTVLRLTAILWTLWWPFLVQFLILAVYMTYAYCRHKFVLE